MYRRMSHRARWVIAVSVPMLLTASIAFALLGDVDEDGQITGADVQLVLQAVVGLQTLSPSQEEAADVDQEENDRRASTVHGGRS